MPRNRPFFYGMIMLTRRTTREKRTDFFPTPEKVIRGSFFAVRESTIRINFTRATFVLPVSRIFPPRRSKAFARRDLLFRSRVPYEEIMSSKTPLKASAKTAGVADTPTVPVSKKIEQEAVVLEKDVQKLDATVEEEKKTLEELEIVDERLETDREIVDDVQAELDESEAVLTTKLDEVTATETKLSVARVALDDLLDEANDLEASLEKRLKRIKKQRKKMKDIESVLSKKRVEADRAMEDNDLRWDEYLEEKTFLEDDEENVKVLRTKLENLTGVKRKVEESIESHKKKLQKVEKGLAAKASKIEAESAENFLKIIAKFRRGEKTSLDVAELKSSDADVKVKSLHGFKVVEALYVIDTSKKAKITGADSDAYVEFSKACEAKLFPNTKTGIHKTLFLHQRQIGPKALANVKSNFTHAFVVDDDEEAVLESTT